MAMAIMFFHPIHPIRDHSRRSNIWNTCTDAYIAMAMADDRSTLHNGYHFVEVATRPVPTLANIIAQPDSHGLSIKWVWSVGRALSCYYCYITTTNGYDLSAGIVSAMPSLTPDDDPCGQAQPCQNGGTCHTGAGQYQCVCSEEYEGENCTLVRTDECNPNPCQNGGECIVRIIAQAIEWLTCGCSCCR